MRDAALASALGLIVGVALGAVFFGGLWLTVRHGVTSRFAPVWFAGSMMVRLGLALVTFLWLGREDPVRLVGALVGFIVARSVVLRITQRIPPLAWAKVAPEVRRGA